MPWSANSAIAGQRGAVPAVSSCQAAAMSFSQQPSASGQLPASSSREQPAAQQPQGGMLCCNLCGAVAGAKDSGEHLTVWNGDHLLCTDCLAIVECDDVEPVTSNNPQGSENAAGKSEDHAACAVSRPCEPTPIPWNWPMCDECDQRCPVRFLLHVESAMWICIECVEIYMDAAKENFI